MSMNTDDFVKEMRKLGWTREPLLGYWKRNGLCMSELNYATHEEALAAFKEKAADQDDEKDFDK